MHIPDGYLSPQTYIPLWVIFAGFMAGALRKIRDRLSGKNIPYLGIAAAFSFLIMMFNIPIPGGTTGHAVGAALVAIIMGPWTALIAVSVALILQALMFGDGGITAIGANCVNMAVIMPFTAAGVFALVRGSSRAGRRPVIAAFLAGYLSLTVAALATAVEFGIQPLIASAAGKPLYAPYPLSIAVPVMTLEHLLIFGPLEGMVTALLYWYFLKNDPSSIEALREERT